MTSPAPVSGAQPAALEAEEVAALFNHGAGPKTQNLRRLAASHELLRARLDAAEGWNERVRVCSDHAQDIAAPVGDCLICTVETLRAEARP